MLFRHAFGKLRSRALGRPAAIDARSLWPRDWRNAPAVPDVSARR
jgi:hypothetical protein